MENSELGLAIKTLKAKRNELQKQVDALNEAIGTLESNFGYKKEVVPTVETSLTNSFSTKYDRKWTYSEKILYVLKEKKRFLQFRQIAEFLLQIQGDNITRAAVSELAIKLSTSSQNIKTKNQIVRYPRNGNNQIVYWGFPEWVDEKDVIRPGHEVISNVNESDE